MLCCKAASGLGIPAISTVVGTGVTDAQLDSKAPAAIEAANPRRVIALLRRTMLNLRPAPEVIGLFCKRRVHS
jgi:hypothetical protein